MTTLRKYWAIAACLLLVAACSKKSDPTLTGNASTAGFTYVINKIPGGDTLPFVSRVTFTNTSLDAFSYFWDFGDATTTVTDNPVKDFPVGKVYSVKLISVGKAGNNTTYQRIPIESSCDFAAFSGLTGCNNRKWQVSPASDAITILNSDGTVASKKAPASCQSDDIFTFFVDGTFGYDAKGQTFTQTCGPALPNATKFALIKNAGGNPRIVLSDTNTATKVFLGTTDPVVGNSYDVLSVSDASLMIQGTLGNGQKIQIQLLNGFDIGTIQLYLTGGSTRSWRLDSTAGAKSVTAGKESNPAVDYGGGDLAVCQKNDWYTFSQANGLVVEYNGDFLDPSKGYSCQGITDLTCPYTFGEVVGSVAGLAQISLVPNNATQWIGVKDRSPENVYRIIAIDNDKMVLRSGNGQGTNEVHEMKFVRK